MRCDLLEQHFQREAHVEAGGDGAVDLVQGGDALEMYLDTGFRLLAQDDGGHLMAEDAHTLQIVHGEFAARGHIQQADGATRRDQRDGDDGVDLENLQHLRQDLFDGAPQRIGQEGGFGELSHPGCDLRRVAADDALRGVQQCSGVAVLADRDTDTRDGNPDELFDLLDQAVRDGGTLHFEVRAVRAEQVDRHVLAVEHVAGLACKDLSDGLDVLAAVGGIVQGVDEQQFPGALLDLAFRPFALGDVDGGNDDPGVILLVPRHHRPVHADFDGLTRQRFVAAFPLVEAVPLCDGGKFPNDVAQSITGQVAEGCLDQFLFAARTVHAESGFVHIQNDDLRGALLQRLGMEVEVLIEVDDSPRFERIQVVLDE